MKEEQGFGRIFGGSMDRRRLLKVGFRSSYSLGLAAFGYGALIERRRPVIERVECQVPERFAALDGLTIAVMSDFHHDEFHDDTLMGTAIEATNALNPDLILLAGDFISDEVEGLEALADHFSRLKARTGIYGVLGNHDQWTNSSAIAARVQKSGVELLRNANVSLRTPAGERVVLAGLESIWGGHPRLAHSLRGVPSDVPVILGWHEPDPFDDLEDDRIALQISGHTHGGQVCAPLFGAIRLPAYGKKFPAGLYRKNDSSLYVTRGIGAMGVPVRFCCPPEISLLTLKASLAGSDEII